VKRKSIMFISTLLFSGCSSKNFIALLDKGSSNAVVIRTKKGCIVLNRPGSYVVLDKSLPKKIEYMPPVKLKQRFAKLYETMPQKPRSYIVYFKPNSLELIPKSQRVLKRVIEEIRKNSPAIVDIIGHTDTTGSFNLNMKLSINRANYIKSLITKNKDLKIIKLSVRGYGEEKLFIKTLDNVSEIRNRSVEIFIK